jgi:predicted DsbA family dithiol-disulfide isomerase
MKIVFYKTFLCPRCFLTGRALARLRRELPELEIETVEVTRDPLRAWQDGVRMLPAVCREGKMLTGLLLTYADLRKFLRP